MKILLLNDTVDLENWGAQAGADALRSILLETYPTAEIKSLTYQWIARKFMISIPLLGSKIYSRETNSLLARFSKDFQFLPLVADEFEFIAKKWLDGLGGPQSSEFINLLSNTDLVVLNAEGSTYRNNFTAIKSLFLLWFAKTQFNIPSYFVNGSVSLTRVDPILPAMVNRTFTVLDGISVREPYSYRNINAYYPSITTTIIPDTAFWLDVNKVTDKTSPQFIKFKSQLGKFPYVCLSLPILLSKINNYYRQPLEFSPLVKTINTIKKIVPQVIIMGKEPSEFYLSKLAVDTGSLYFGPEYTYNDAIELLRGANFLVSGRYHHLIFASMVGCPIIPLTSSSHKIEGLCELLGDAVTIKPLDSTNLFAHQDSISKYAQLYCDEQTFQKEKISKRSKDLSKQVLLLGKLFQPM